MEINGVFDILDESYPALQNWILGSNSNNYARQKALEESPNSSCGDSCRVCDLRKENRLNLVGKGSVPEGKNRIQTAGIFPRLISFFVKILLHVFFLIFLKK